MLPQIDVVTAAVLRLAEKLTVVDAESLPVERVAGRVLAVDVHADRDSPPLNVSAMDGYALRIADIAASSSLPVIAVATAGSPAPLLPAELPCRSSPVRRCPAMLTALCRAS